MNFKAPGQGYIHCQRRSTGVVDAFFDQEAISSEIRVAEQDHAETAILPWLPQRTSCCSGLVRVVPELIVETQFQPSGSQP